jgi:Rrf2 family protein
MLKLNRTTEYGLIALQHMSLKAKSDTGARTSAREVADAYGLPFEITAKTLQRLRDLELIQSEQGAKGGYVLNRSLAEVSLAEFLQGMEGQQGVVQCVPHAEGQASCGLSSKCAIQGVMGDLSYRLNQFLSQIKLAELTLGATHAPGLSTGLTGVTAMAAAGAQEP